MDRYRLKNIMIIILALVNFFLVGTLIARKTDEEMAHRRIEEQLVELFAADGMALDVGVIPEDTQALPLTMSRDTQREREVAAFFLGEALRREDQGGGIYSYTSEHGVALFRGDGSFDVAGTLAIEDAEMVCQEFCKTFSYDTPAFVLDENRSGAAVAAYRYDKQPVFNCTVTFNLDRGILQTVSGTLLPESGVAASTEQELLSPHAALTVFQKMRRESGAVVSAVTEIYPCYRLQSTTAVPMSLTPAWCIVTDTSRYYVNRVSGAVTTG